MKFHGLSLAFALTAATTGFIGCADQNEPDELAGETGDVVDDGADAKADASNTAVSTFYTITPDLLRRCRSPICGGKFVKRVNRTTTICHNGSVSDTCYVPELDYSRSGLSEAQLASLDKPILVRGRFANKNYGMDGNLGTFVVSEVWLGQSDSKPTGTFVRIKDSGARCIAAPCENKIERSLNGTRQANIAEIGWESANLTDEATQASIESSFREGVIVAGSRFTVSQGGRTGKGRSATAVYRKVIPGADAACFIGGCSAQVCSENPGVITTCEARPEYACYHTASCARQTNGSCGWTMTPALEACLGQ
jgi:hypothetical protein